MSALRFEPNQVSELAMQRGNRFAACESDHKLQSSAAQIVEFERLFTQCESDVQSFIFALLPHWPDAEDVLQRTRIISWQKFASFSPGSSFRAWIRQVARFEVNNFLRTQRSDRLCFNDGLIDCLADVHSSLGDELEWRRITLDNCVRKLRASDRQIIRHCYGPNSTTTKEAAERLQRPVNTLYKALNRIRRSLLKCVQQKMVDEQREQEWL